jgi:hypothetical protein
MGQGLKFFYEYAETNVPSLNTFNLNLNVRDLWPIVILCSVTILLTLLWLLAVWEYLLKINKHSSELQEQQKRSNKLQ